MRNWLQTHKPGAPAAVHLLLAALVWSVVGALLAFFGGRWLVAGQEHFAAALLAAAAAVGVLKSRLALDRAARRIIARIRARGDGKCLGGFLSPRTWLLVAVMAGSGRLLRWSGLVPLALVGFIYTAVGTALLFASRHPWRAWYCDRC